MIHMIQNAKDQVLALTHAAYEVAVAAGKLPADVAVRANVEIPKDPANGDYTTTFALAAAKAMKKSPREIAGILLENLKLEDSYFASAEIAGAGFLNFRLAEKWYREVLAAVESEGAAYGRSDALKGQRIMVEFVSANPTGPMHMGNARGGALGDCLAAVLDAAGYNVWREFYVNDAGNQIEKFGLSLSIRYQQLFAGENAPELPEDSYHGEYITDFAKAYADIHGDELMSKTEEERRHALVSFALPQNIAKMKADMKKYRIEYDEWFLESRLHEDGEVKAIVDLLTEKGLTYEQDGAIWYKGADFTAKYAKVKNKDDEQPKDEVLVRQNGNPTYMTADIAYHKNKFDRGFERCIDIWGADHHGHVARMKGAMDAIGMDGEKLDVVLMQLVKLVRGGEIVRMSKRTGKAIQLSDLLDEVPVDAARFLFNMREANSQMDFDLDLAIQQDAQNPVYYVQYAHARICSILKALAADGISPRECTDEELALLTAPEEVELIRHLSAYTDEIIGAARDYDPARITRYVITAATLFHKFYNACRVKGVEESLSAARLTLCLATKTVIANVLNLLKITVPETM